MPVDLGDSSCLMIPTVPPKHILYAVWPDNNGNSCTCPLCHSGYNECALSDCPCYSESSFEPTLRIGQNMYKCDAWVWHMGVVQEVTAANSDHRTGWTRFYKLVQSSFFACKMSDAILM